MNYKLSVFCSELLVISPSSLLFYSSFSCFSSSFLPPTFSSLCPDDITVYRITAFWDETPLFVYTYGKMHMFQKAIIYVDSVTKKSPQFLLSGVP